MDSNLYLGARKEPKVGHMDSGLYLGARKEPKVTQGQPLPWSQKG